MLFVNKNVHKCKRKEEIHLGLREKDLFLNPKKESWGKPSCTKGWLVDG